MEPQSAAPLQAGRSDPWPETAEAIDPIPSEAPPASAIEPLPEPSAPAALTYDVDLAPRIHLADPRVVDEATVVAPVVETVTPPATSFEPEEFDPAPILAPADQPAVVEPEAEPEAVAAPPSPDALLAPSQPQDDAIEPAAPPPLDDAPPYYEQPSPLPEPEPEPEPEPAPEPTATPAPDADPVDRIEQPAFETRAEPNWQASPMQAVVPHLDDHFAREDAAADDSRWDRLKQIGRTGLRYAGYAVGGYFALVLLLILVYRFVNPPASSLMVVQAITGTDVRQDWVSLDDISPALVRAVIVSEDWTFCEHYGIDIAAIEQAIERSGNGIPRGASTISMQTTKNLFLWNAKSFIRKAVELPLTLAIETVWPKRRILEIYLNVAEWGPGIFGAEAAAQYHFNKPASRLGEREAAQLAASLPNPIIREAGDPGPRTARKATVIQSRMRNAGDAAQCVLGSGR